MRHDFKDYHNIINGRGLFFGNPKGSIFKEHNAVFVHIPKTGGTSVKNLFNTSDKVIVPPGRAVHASAYSIKECLEGDFEKYKSFSIVRDPYDRLISAFLFSAGSMHLKYSGDSEKLYDIFNNFIQNKLQNMIFNVLYIPQTALLSDLDGNVLIDNLFLFDEFKKINKYVTNTFGIDKTIKHLNNNADVKEQLNLKKSKLLSDKKTKSIIKEVYQQDIKLFNKIKRESKTK